jgi:hypothetical protein
MTSYVFELKKCTNCESEFISNSLLSSNTSGAVFYTDGYMSGPMYSEDIYIVKCPKCNSYIWKSSLPTVKHISESEFFRNQGDDNFGSLFNDRIDFKYLLAKPIWTNTEQEKYVRIRACWSYNNKYRTDKFKYIPPAIESYYRENPDATKFLITTEQERNLKRILELFDSKNEHERLMMAEIHRELGNFNQCTSLLDFNFTEDCKNYAGAISKLNNEKVSKVEIIS